MAFIKKLLINGFLLKSKFLVYMNSEVASVGKQIKMGNHCQLTAGVFVSDDCLVGVAGKKLNEALTSLILGRADISACSVGVRP